MTLPRYRRFEPGEVERRAEVIDVGSALGGPGACMARADFELASLFDGARSAADICRDALARLSLRINRTRLEGFAAQLAEVGLLRAGRDEPLPTPAHSTAEQRARGWSGAGSDVLPDQGRALPPAALPGSRSGPGLAGGLAGLSGVRGKPHRMAMSLAPGPFITLGRVLLWPLWNRAALLGFALLLVTALSLAFTHRLEWTAHLREAWGGARLLIAWVFAAYLANLFSASARAAAIWRHTPESPRIGIRLGFMRVPSLYVDTAGAAERAPRAARLRIVGASLIGTGMLFLLAVLSWFLNAQTEPVLARLAVTTALLALVMSLLRLNPLARFDGYALLCNALNNLNLRNEAMTVLFGGSRPWATQGSALSRRTLALYAAAVLLFLVALFGFVVAFVGGWLVERFSGTGFFILAAVSGVFMQKQYIGSSASRSRMGWPGTSWRPSRGQKIAAGVIALVCLIPYPYSPGGEFEVLPRNRADVRALTAGDVREVLVQEGQTVAANQPIARLDEAGQKSRVAAAEAELRRFESELALVRKGARSEEIEVARQRVATAKSASDIARSQAERITQAYKGKGVTPQEYDRARGAADVAQQQLQEARRGLELVESPAQAERVAALEAEVQRVQADLMRLRQDLEYTTVRAPIAGRIVSSQLQFSRGHYLERGALLATVEDTGELIAEIRMPESVIGEVQIDAQASAKPWAYPGSSFGGRVRSIAPAAEVGEYGRVVRVQMVVEDPDKRLKTGMTGNAKVDAGWQLSIVVFTKAILRFVLVEVWSWIP